MKPRTTEFHGVMVFSVTSTVVANSTTYRTDNTFTMPGAPGTVFTAVSTTSTTTTNTVISEPNSNIMVSGFRIGTFK